jgi:preprotein translocase subunit SecB
MTEQAQEERQFAIQRIYTKDISFESPNSPQVFLGEWKPEINVGINSRINVLGNDNIEVVLTINVEAKQGENTAFMVEVQQGAIFLVKGFSDEEMGPLLGIGAPNALFPYAREVVSDLVTRGSFPQFVMQPVNFEAMYAQQVAQQRQQAGEETH